MSLAMPSDAQFTTTFPEWVADQIGNGYVLVAKSMLDFDYCKPDDLEGAHEHVEWFHNFWWVNNGNTRTKMIAFFDTQQEAILAGEKLDHMIWWAVYNSAGVIKDGKY